jgi:hypothetical protein
MSGEDVGELIVNFVCLPILAIEMIAAALIIAFGLPLDTVIRGVREMKRRRGHVARVEDEWRRAGRDIRLPPVRAKYYGSEPPKVYDWRHTSGALGLVDGQMIFVPRDDRPGLMIPFERICWIGTRAITIREGWGKSQRQVSREALIVHYEGDDEWTGQPRYCVAAFLTKARIEIAGALSAETGLTYHVSEPREDFGPERATRLRQDIYGQWSPAPRSPRYLSVFAPADLPSDWLSQGDLYLAPDRLLFDYQDPIYLAQIRRLEVYHKGVLGRLNPFDDELLRIEYATPEGENRVTGYALRQGEAFGQAIHDFTGAPWEVHTGRKKKAG